MASLKRQPHCPIPPTIFVTMDQTGIDGGSRGHKASTTNYSEDELTSLMGLILDMLPIKNADDCDLLVSKYYAQSWPYSRSKTSIKTKYAAVKCIKSSTGNLQMPEYAKMA